MFVIIYIETVLEDDLQLTGTPAVCMDFQFLLSNSKHINLNKKAHICIKTELSFNN